MAYVGNQPAANFASVTKDTFNGGDTSGASSVSEYTLSKAATTNGVAVFVENVRQEPTTAYSVSGTTLTFTGTTPSGTNNVYVLHHNAPASTANHPASQDLTAVKGTFTSDVSIDGGSFVFNESSADVDFRIESNGEQNMLLVDAGNDAVIMGHSVKVDGINDDNEGVKGSGGHLQLHGATPCIDFFSYSTTNGTHGGINFMKSRNDTVGGTGTITTGDVIGSIQFGGYDSSDYASIAGKIDFQMGGSSVTTDQTAGEMVFYTSAQGTGGSGTSERMRVTSAGQINGDFNDTSDERLKENISDISDNQIATVKQLRPVTFDWKEKGKGSDTGFIAQEVQKLLPNDVHSYGDDSTLAINLQGVVAVLTKALQEAITRIEALESK